MPVRPHKLSYHGHLSGSTLTTTRNNHIILLLVNAFLATLFIVHIRTHSSTNNVNDVADSPLLARQPLSHQQPAEATSATKRFLSSVKYSEFMLETISPEEDQEGLDDDDFVGPSLVAGQMEDPRERIEESTIPPVKSPSTEAENEEVTNLSPEISSYEPENATGNEENATEKEVNVTTAVVRNFLDVALSMSPYVTDKVDGNRNLEPCLKTGQPCMYPNAIREACRPWGHFYDTLYQRWLAEPYSRDDVEPFQFLEIGYYTGNGFAAFQEFMPNAEAHSIEVSCVEGSTDDSARRERPEIFDQLRANNRLHCGSAANQTFLQEVWNQQMNRTTNDDDAPSSPPLKIVVDDGSHLAEHMVTTFFFWFPKIEPGGFLIVEDIQPIPSSNKFRSQFLPQIMSDLHYCGLPSCPEEPFFPTIWPLLKSISCEMHICIFERNSHPATSHLLTPDELRPPKHSLDYGLAITKTQPKKTEKKKTKSPSNTTTTTTNNNNKNKKQKKKSNKALELVKGSSSIAK